MLVIPRKENVCLESLGKEFAKRLGFDEWWRCGILMKEWWHLLKLGTGVGRKWVFFERHDKNEKLDRVLKKDHGYYLRIDPPPLPASLVSCLDGFGCDVYYPRRGASMYIRGDKNDPSKPVWISTKPNDYVFPRKDYPPRDFFYGRRRRWLGAAYNHD